MSKRIALVMVIACFIAVIGGVIALASLKDDDNNLLQNTTITLSGDDKRTFTAQLDGLYPGGQKSYEININGESAKDLQISLTFRNFKDSELKNYINVEIKSNDQTITKTLKELLDKEQTISLGTNVSNIQITYSMPENVGNESQQKSISFYLDVTAKRSAE